jgi:phosphoribosylglycinamide formyltransferase-1
VRLVVLISGSGSNLGAILDACASGRLDAQVVAVFSNRREAYGLERARAFGVPGVYVPKKPFAELGREAYDADLADKVAAYQPTLVVCAGWMHVLSSAFLDRFAGRVINLHPALPGEYPGVHAIERAWNDAQAGLRDHTGIMVHHVIPEIDAGPVLATARVDILPGEPLEALEARVHAAEHALLVSAIAALRDELSESERA